MHLYARFTNALAWNAAAFIAYKILFTLLTLTLFGRLDTLHFSQWATTNSIIYLVVLWTDGGLRASIPRFVPLFSQSPQLHARFLRLALKAKSFFMLMALFPFLIYLAHYQHLTSGMMLAAAGVFISQGIVSTLQTLYHAHFWNKQFNIISTAFLAGDMLISCIAAFLISDPESLVLTLFSIRIISSVLTILTTLAAMPLVRTHTHPELSPYRLHIILKAATVHTIFMGGTTILKSLSERNFLLPFFTHVLGPIAGNIFKVANDLALLFYRLIIKTIGSADTAVLSHIQAGAGTEDSMRDAFEKITTKVAALLFPVVGIVVTLFLFDSGFFKDKFVFHLFLIMIGGYLLETLIMQAERMVEVRRVYTVLAYAYVPYVIGMLLLILTGLYIAHTSFVHLHSYVPPFVMFIVWIQGVRLVYFASLLWYVSKRYRVSLPYFPMMRIMGYTLLFFVSLWMILLVGIGASKHLLRG